MEKKEIDLIAPLKAIWSQKRKLIIWGINAFIVGMIVAFSIPKEYISSVTIAPENKSQASSAQLGGLAAMVGMSSSAMPAPGINESVYPQIVKSAPFLGEFRDIEVPYNGIQITLFEYLTQEQKAPWWGYVFGAPMRFIGWIFSSSDEKNVDKEIEDPTNPSPQMRAFESALANRMTIESDKKTSLINMTVSMQDPKIALIVADSMLSKLSRYMINYYTAKARKDLEVSEEMLTSAKKEYFKVDSAYAAMVDKNQNLISRSAQIKLERYESERDIAYSVYQQVAGQVESNKMALQKETPIATVIEPARMPDRPISPNRKMIIVSITFMGVFITAMILLIKEISARK